MMVESDVDKSRELIGNKMETMVDSTVADGGGGIRLMRGTGDDSTSLSQSNTYNFLEKGQ